MQGTQHARAIYVIFVGGVLIRLHSNIIRLVALSFGSSELTQELYDYTINLEKMRLSRLEPYPSAQPQK